MEMKKIMRKIIKVFIVVCVVVSLTAHRSTATNPIKTHLVGRDGLCLDSDGSSRYNFPKLVPCKPKEDTQLWTFPDDNTTRWANDKCLFPYGMKVIKEYILVRTGQCNELQDEDKIWTLNKKDSTLIHVHSGLVLTVQNNSNFVNIDVNRNDRSQLWDAIDLHSTPRAGYIMGLYSYKCLMFSPNYPILSSHTCRGSDIGTYQLWALFDDGTIRANANRSLCITSIDHYVPYYLLVVIKCEGKAEQRWEIDVDDSTIHHPNSTLVVDVIMIERPVMKQKTIALFTRNGASTQKWTFLEK